MLDILFLVGAVWFTAFAVATFVLSWMRWRTGRENPGHLVAWAHTALAVLYWFLYVDAFFYLRGDGVEMPWVRMIAEIIVYMTYAWMVCVSLWLDWDDAAIVVIILTGVGGAMVTLSHLVANPNYWWGFAGGAGVLALAQLWTLRKSRRPDLVAWLLWGGWMIWIVGVPLVQLLGWTMTEVLDKSPARNTTEILYLVVYGLGVTVYGIVQIFIFTSRPPSRPLRQSPEQLVPPQQNCNYMQDPCQLVSSEHVNSGVQHRNVTWASE